MQDWQPARHASMYHFRASSGVPPMEPPPKREPHRSLRWWNLLAYALGSIAGLLLVINGYSLWWSTLALAACLVIDRALWTLMNRRGGATPAP